ncbi:sensor histidine kinase [Nocardioides alcanivorans]|uniref:sensor histidine kinase n=1 Tax=Nocardioides alcanivorans TaxID=2897352 RepID=UPI001F35CE9C|nr:HAMP domain-containing sensor histidine kinase [Nocardioides alcanivorans]
MVDAPANPPRSRRPGLSVRIRLTLALALLAALAMALVGALVYAVESSRLHDQAVEHADQEFAEFAKLQSTGIDPDTRQPFADLKSLFRVFIQRNVPSDAEVLAGWLLDQAELVSLSAHGNLAKEPAVVDAVNARVVNGGDTTVDTSDGEVLVSVQPVTHTRSDETGALVVITVFGETHDELRSLMRTYVLVSLLALAVITALAALQAGRLLSPLRRLDDTAREISGSDLSLRIPETGNDDITRLTRTVNQMLDRLESAFADQRLFLDAAGHELKTPLTVLQGHLELMDPSDPVEVAETQRLLLDETDRMARLVNDLIQLAKSARPDYVRREPVDLHSLISTVLAKASGLADRVWVDDGGPELVLQADEQRLTQALLQLADNAVKHTDTGDEIGVGARSLGSHVELWVRDSGDGVPEADRARIFDRFARSNVRSGDEGFGLGLSLVRAIAEAHDGTVSHEPEPDGGSRFLLTLPLEDPWPAS